MFEVLAHGQPIAWDFLEAKFTLVVDENCSGVSIPFLVVLNRNFMILCNMFEHGASIGFEVASTKLAVPGAFVVPTVRLLQSR